MAEPWKKHDIENHLCDFLSTCHLASLNNPISRPESLYLVYNGLSLNRLDCLLSSSTKYKQ